MRLEIGDLIFTHIEEAGNIFGFRHVSIYVGNDFALSYGTNKFDIIYLGDLLP